MPASDVHPLVEKVLARLSERGETISFAESCTGGLLSSMLTALPGTSSVFVGSVVAYSNVVKVGILGVESTLIQAIGAVSLPVARQMATGSRMVFGTSWALSITGVAGPGGGSEAKPVGTVCFGIHGPGVDRAEQQLFKGGRRKIQKASAEHALTMLLSELGETEGSHK